MTFKKPFDSDVNGLVTRLCLNDTHNLPIELFKVEDVGRLGSVERWSDDLDPILGGGLRECLNGLGGRSFDGFW